MDSNNKSIIQVDVDLWAWPLTIYPNHWPRKAIRTSSNPVNTPVVIDGLCKHNLAASEQKETAEKHCKSRIADCETDIFFLRVSIADI